MTFPVNVTYAQSPSGETTNIVLTYTSSTAKTYYSNNGIKDISYNSSVDGIFDATSTVSGAIITGLKPGSTWVVHVESVSDLSGGTEEINVEGTPAKPLKGINFTVTEYTYKIHFDFSTNIWNHGIPSSAKVIIKSLNHSKTFKTVTKLLSATEKSFDISDLEVNTQYEVKVQLTSTIGAGPMSDSFVVSTDNNRAAVTITSATGVHSLEKELNKSYVDICFNVGTTSNKAHTGDNVRFALNNSTTLMTESSVINVDNCGNSHVRLTSTELTGGSHSIKLLVRNNNSENVNSTSDGNTSNSKNFTIQLKPLAPSFTIDPHNTVENKIDFSFNTGANNGWSDTDVTYKAVIAAVGTVAGASNELLLTPTQVSSGVVSLTKGQLTGLTGVKLNSDLNIHIKKTVDGSIDVNDNSATNLVLNGPSPAYGLFYIVDPSINSVSVTESDDPSRNYLHITYDISGAAVATESVLKAYIRYDQPWNVNAPNTASAESSSSFTLGPQLKGVDIAIDSGAIGNSTVYVVLELNNEGKKAYRAAGMLTLQNKEPEPKLENLFGWSDYTGTDTINAAFDFEFDQPDGILGNLKFEVWLKDSSSGVFKNVVNNLTATKLRAGGVTIRASIKKSDIVDASGLGPSDPSYSAPSQLSFGVAQTNSNYALSSSDFKDGFTNDQGKVTQAVASVKYHPVNVDISSVTVNPSNKLTVEVTGTNLAGNTYVITVFDSSSNANIGLGNGATGTFVANTNNNLLIVNTASPILTEPEYRLVLQVKNNNGDVASQATQVFTYAFAPKIATSVPLNKVTNTKWVDISLNNNTTPTDVSGRYSVNITPNGAALTSVQAMYYSDSAATDTFAKVDVPVNTPSDTLNGTYTAYLDFTNNMEGAILMAANSSGMDAHHFSAPQ